MRRAFFSFLGHKRSTDSPNSSSRSLDSSSRQVLRGSSEELKNDESKQKPTAITKETDHRQLTPRTPPSKVSILDSFAKQESKSLPNLFRYESSMMSAQSEVPGSLLELRKLLHNGELKEAVKNADQETLTTYGKVLGQISSVCSENVHEVICVGALNSDFRFEAGHKAHDNANDLVRTLGGKAATEALVAASFLSREAFQPIVSFVGNVCNDPDGLSMTRLLESYGVIDWSHHPNIEQGGRSGVVSIVPDKEAKSGRRMVVVPGSNKRFGKEAIANLEERLDRMNAPGPLKDGHVIKQVVLLSREIPHERNIEVAKLARSKGAFVVLNVRARDDATDNEGLYSSEDDGEAARLGKNMDVALAREVDLIVLDVANLRAILEDAEKKHQFRISYEDAQGRSTLKEKTIVSLCHTRPASAVLQLQKATTGDDGRSPGVVLSPIPRTDEKQKPLMSALVAERRGEIWVLPPPSSSTSKTGGVDAFVAGIGAALCMGHTLRIALLWASGLQSISSRAAALQNLIKPPLRRGRRLSSAPRDLHELPASPTASLTRQLSSSSIDSVAGSVSSEPDYHFDTSKELQQEIARDCVPLKHYTKGLESSYPLHFKAFHDWKGAMLRSGQDGAEAGMYVAVPKGEPEADLAETSGKSHTTGVSFDDEEQARVQVEKEAEEKIKEWIYDLSGPETLPPEIKPSLSPQKLARLIIDDDVVSLQRMSEEPGPSKDRTESYNSQVWQERIERYRNWLGQTVLHLATASASHQVYNYLKVGDQRLKECTARLAELHDKFGRAAKPDELDEGKSGSGLFQSAERLKKAEDGVEMDFWFVSADKLRALDKGAEMTLCHQQLLQKKRDWMGLFRISQDHCIKRRERGPPKLRKFLIISHRWEEAEHPDSECNQLKEIREFLRSEQGSTFEWVWMDYWCLPQKVDGRERTPEEHMEFDLGLKNVSLLYLGGIVLILLDNSYMARFWTQFEAWLSMQTPTIYGLRGSDDLNFRRCIIRCMYSALPQDADKLREAWGKAKVTPEEARKQLEMRDVAVTNKKDKTTQLDKLIRLNHKVKTYNSDDVGNDNIPDPIRIDKAPPAGPPTYVV